MRHNILSAGAKELTYEIREIVKKAEQVQATGQPLYWENIGDPIQKRAQVPQWMKEIISGLTLDNSTYSYCPSKGVLATRQFLAERNNQRGGVQITADDILFFNGLGDAIGKVYQYIHPGLRVIGPSPAYSTHSSAEAAHAGQEPITYTLDPDNHWFPDLDDLYNKVKYNPTIIGILIINPDNPTGMVYPLESLQRIVAIAREFKLLLISDEIYLNITYNGARAYSLAEVIGEVPGIAMKGISKELPWPGSRCGWMEYYNRDKNPEFARFCAVLDNAKMIEVCSTTLPQLAIPLIMGDARFARYRQEQNERIGRRSRLIADILGTIPELTFNETYGAFYNTIIFREGVLRLHQQLPIANPQLRAMVEGWVAEEGMALDKRFVYYLLAATGICVVPISSFCSQLQGFRVTLLEEDEEVLVRVFTQLRDAIKGYLAS
ncbi:pyridoxal phosphate-dependent aminotransferase [Cesiribacter andamanensis]|uniref:alanine transaminase n=1 Tax=Cesiribacter andamanensis AMV16 TaxID=1279009 RepID=M7N4A3_9BACT|nr:pyridoxal phosphate-dependent aminotransferase [Cesiribacter andamanensis]EMR02046.1 Aspartate aminotransferase [Cesiribacter andamanensis AMV16]